MDMKKEFKSSTGILIVTSLFIWFVCGFVLCMLAAAGADLYTSLTRAEAGTAYYVASVSTAILTATMPALILAVFSHRTVSVTSEEILWESGFHTPRRIPLKGNAFSSTIMSLLDLGIWPTRYLSVTTNGVQRFYMCSCFSKDTFDQMMAAVQEAAVNANRFN